MFTQNAKGRHLVMTLKEAHSQSDLPIVPEGTQGVVIAVYGIYAAEERRTEGPKPRLIVFEGFGMRSVMPEKLTPIGRTNDEVVNDSKGTFRRKR